ncbi:AAA family ATPase [Candidatus Woesearchaeota archaeon]|nr:AAA family ATPase [Candidatus Woesearchaeota archaeon]
MSPNTKNKNKTINDRRIDQDLNKDGNYFFKKLLQDALDSEKEIRIEQAIDKEISERKSSMISNQLSEFESGLDCKIIGVGGAGCNYINWLFMKGIKGAELIGMDSNQENLDLNKADKKFLIGKTHFKGKGSGDFKDCSDAIEKDYDQIKSIIATPDITFVCTGLGGGTGTGGAPFVAEIAKLQGSMVVGIATLPFKSLKGQIKSTNVGLVRLSNICDTVIIIDNNKLVDIAGNLPVQQAFAVCNDIISSLLKGIVEMIAVPSLVNLDFADIKAILQNGKTGTIGVGAANLSVGTKAVVKGAMDNLLMENDPVNAESALILIFAGQDITLEDINIIGEHVTENLNQDANVLWGCQVSDDMKGKVMVITLLTGFNSPIETNKFIEYDHYPTRKLGEIVEIKKGSKLVRSAKPTTAVPIIDESAFNPFLKNKILTKRIDKNLISTIDLVQEGDVLLYRKNNRNILFMLAGQNLKGYTYESDVVRIRITHKSDIMPELLLAFLKQKYDQNESINISLVNLRKIHIPIPPLNEQVRIIGQLEQGRKLERKRIYERIKEIENEFLAFRTIERIITSKLKITNLLDLYSKYHGYELPEKFSKSLLQVPNLVSSLLNTRDRRSTFRNVKLLTGHLKTIDKYMHDSNFIDYMSPLSFSYLESWTIVIKSLRNFHAHADYIEDAIVSTAYYNPDKNKIVKIKDSIPLPQNLKRVKIKQNPYVIGQALMESDQNVFKGRKDIFKFIQENFEQTIRESIILLIGPRRVGKSSTLRMLHLNISEQYIPVYIDLQAGCFTKEGVSTFFISLAEDIQESLSKRGLDVTLPEDSSFEEKPMYTFERKFLHKQVIPKLKENKIIIMFDEFEALDEGVKSGKIDKDIFDNLRHLMQHVKQLCFIFSGTHKLEDEYLSDYWSFLFQMVKYCKIGYLNKKYTFQLITEPVSDYGMVYTKSALDRIYELSAGHPYVVQFLCRELVTLYNKELLAEISREEVDKVIDKIIVGQYTLFDHLWGDSSNIGQTQQRARDKVTKVLLIAISELVRDKSNSSVTDIVNYLSDTYRYSLDLSIAREILNNLKRKLILNVSKENQWYFRLDLLRLWILTNKNIEEHLEDLIKNMSISSKVSKLDDMATNVSEILLDKGLNTTSINDIRSLISEGPIDKKSLDILKKCIFSSTDIRTMNFPRFRPVSMIKMRKMETERRITFLKDNIAICTKKFNTDPNKEMKEELKHRIFTYQRELEASTIELERYNLHSENPQQSLNNEVCEYMLNIVDRRKVIGYLIFYNFNRKMDEKQIVEIGQKIRNIVPDAKIRLATKMTNMHHMRPVEIRVIVFTK